MSPSTHIDLLWCPQAEPAAVQPERAVGLSPRPVGQPPGFRLAVDRYECSVAVSLKCPVDRWSGHAKQVCQIAIGVFAGAEEGHEMCLLPTVELGLLTTQVGPGLSAPHALAHAQSDEVGLELSDHRQHVEQQPPTGSVGS
jgi:hypothetical protein